MSSEQFEPSLKFVLKWEGSRFTNDPDDRGGATRYGVTQRVYDGYRKRQGKATRTVEDISMDEVRAIYRGGYWAPTQGDRSKPPVDLVLFDTGILMGVGTAARFLQQALGVEVDGDIGPGTLRALDAADARRVAARVLDLREARLHDIVRARPSQKKFLKGWLNRLNDLRRTAGLAGAELEAMIDEGVDASVSSGEPDDSAAVGRADAALPGEEDEPSGDDGSAWEGEPIPLLTPAAPLALLAAARTLLVDPSRSAVFVLHVRASSDSALRVSSPSAGGADAFEIPVPAVESVALLGVHGGDAGLLLVTVTFNPGFEALVPVYQRLLGGAAQQAADEGVEGEADFQAGGGGGDDDPAAPGATEMSEVADLATARVLTNVGTGVVMAETAETEALRPETGATHPTLPIDAGKMRGFLQACMTSAPRVTYGLGAKVPSISAMPGRDFKKVDCSGFVREALRRSTEPRVAFPDGSVVQHDWVKARNFRKSNVQAAFKQDGAIRIAFLRPQDAPSGIGHVVLVQDAKTLESHGGTGPNARAWTGTGWQSKAFVYRLTDPPA